VFVLLAIMHPYIGNNAYLQFKCIKRFAPKSRLLISECFVRSTVAPQCAPPLLANLLKRRLCERRYPYVQQTGHLPTHAIQELVYPRTEILEKLLDNLPDGAFILLIKNLSRSRYFAPDRGPGPPRTVEPQSERRAYTLRECRTSHVRAFNLGG
jgi:hypothetical protein